MLAALHLSRRRLLSALAVAPLLALAIALALVVGRSRPAPPSLASGPQQNVNGGAAGREIPMPQWPKAHQAAAQASPAQVQADPEAAQSFVVSRADVRNAPAAAPATTHVAPGAPSDAQVRAELRQMHAIMATPAAAAGVIVPGGSAGGGGSVGGNGAIPIPGGIPQVIQRVIAGGNAIADFPYVYGGGHASFVDNAYDCSGSVSYALAAGGLLHAPETSGQLESWGVPGPGKWITVFASAGHVWMVVNGVRFDTSGRSGPYGSRWQHAARSTAGFVVRHYPGL